ncbi:integrase core domain-containing protein [Hymenobacter frigidus]|uniref:integrase core domain-containing protein n=1 Tax=Hymenobacter frigidus TaxID=1524095 RepID=UPI00166E87AB
MLLQCPTGYDPNRNLKTEVLEARDWPIFSDLADAQASVAEYFDYCNHDRCHSSISHQKPYPFHQQ